MTTYEGWRLVVKCSGTTVSQVTRIHFDVLNNIDAKEICGTRYSTLVEGNFLVQGSIERHYTSTSEGYTWAGANAGENALTTYYLTIYPAGGSSPYQQINGVKFNKCNIQQRPSANLMIETTDFMATGSITNG